MPYGLVKTEGIVALNLYSKRYRLISLPQELGHDWRCSNSRVHVGVVHEKVRLAQFFWYKKKQCYVFKVWELVDPEDNNYMDIEDMWSWNLVHNHDEMMIRFGCMSLLRFTILALHPDDKDVFFFSRSNNNARDDVEIYQCQILGQNRNQIELIYHLLPKYRNHLRVVPLLHPWWPTRI
uniref:F-box protein n=1 Tax=Cannabis sativa TaxID=3483 RepID=A0A803QF11_CANSA